MFKADMFKKNINLSLENYLLLNGNLDKKYKFDFIFWFIVIIWIIEWTIIFEYLFAEWWRSYIVIPVRTPNLLIVCVFYWIFIWCFCVWRRTQFGRFIRGDRKLWAKALAAFWVAEFVTIGSLIVAYCWMNWGTLPLVPRRLILPKKGILLELTIYTYIIYLTYLAKFSLLWCEWKYQFILAITVLIVFSLLMWRDLMCLFFRDAMMNYSGSRWKNVRLTALVYSLSHEWWSMHIIGRRSCNFRFLSLVGAYKFHLHPLKTIVGMTEYEIRHWLAAMDSTYRAGRAMLLVNKIDFEEYYANFNILNGGYFYPRRVGFIPKRLAMWQLLLFLKMWHHLIILLWWVLYVYRTVARKNNSYNFLGSCAFNVYCCYVMGLMIYFVYFAVFWESFLKLRPGVFNLHRFSLLVVNAIKYIWGGIFSGWQQLRWDELAGYWGLGVCVVLVY